MKKAIFIVLILVLGVVGYFSYSFYIFSQWSSMEECGMSAGPIYGKKIKVDIKKLKLEQEIVISNGKLGLVNLADTLSPKIIRFGNHENIIWAVEFSKDLSLGLPHESLSEMSLSESEDGFKLSFFNYSYGEPGVIYLTKNYELEYMCLSPM